jgi:hypothetical protein
MCQKLTASGEQSIGGPSWHRAQTSPCQRIIAFICDTVIWCRFVEFAREIRHPRRAALTFGLAHAVMVMFEAFQELSVSLFDGCGDLGQQMWQLRVTEVGLGEMNGDLVARVPDAVGHASRLRSKVTLG